MEVILVLLYIVAVFVALWTFFCLFLWSHELLYRSGFHWNIKLLCWNVIISSILYCLFYLVCLLHKAMNRELFTEEVYKRIYTIRAVFIVRLGGQPIMICVERSLSTIFVRQYEAYTHTRQKVLWGAFLGTYWVLEIVYCFFAGVTDIHQNMVSGGIYYVLLVFSTAVCLFLYRYNIQKFNSGNRVVQLSERYQTSENIRVLKRVTVFALICIFHVTFFTVGYVILGVYMAPRYNGTPTMVLSNFVYETLCLLTVSFLPLPFLTEAKDFRAVYWLWSSVRPRSAVHAEKQLRSVTGTNLNPENETGLYFDQLRNSWGCQKK